MTTEDQQIPIPQNTQLPEPPQPMGEPSIVFSPGQTLTDVGNVATKTFDTSAEVLGNMTEIGSSLVENVINTGKEIGGGFGEPTDLFKPTNIMAGTGTAVQKTAEIGMKAASLSYDVVSGTFSETVNIASEVAEKGKNIISDIGSIWSNNETKERGNMGEPTDLFKPAQPLDTLGNIASKTAKTGAAIVGGTVNMGVEAIGGAVNLGSNIISKTFGFLKGEKKEKSDPSNEPPQTPTS